MLQHPVAVVAGEPVGCGDVDVEGLDGLDTVAVEPPGDEDLPSRGLLLAGWRDPGDDASWEAVDLVLPRPDDYCVGVVESYLAGCFDQGLACALVHAFSLDMPLTCSLKRVASASRSATPFSALANDGLPMMPVSV